MRWRSGRDSNNIEDRRDDNYSGGSGGGGGMRFGLLGTVAIVLIGTLLGADPMKLFNSLGGTDALMNSATPQINTSIDANDESGKFASKVFARTEDVWNTLFQQMGSQYREPKLVLFSRTTQSGCGYSSAATGPFYCPADEKVYIDLDFFNELHRLGASGEFARAYVLGHEVGHHVQNLMGITDKISSMQARMSERNANALSVALELQADCFAGVWANISNKQTPMLEAGDVEAAINAAGAIGDDRLQEMSGRYVNPDSFTHGSSRQRIEWFSRGLQSGNINSCDTFGS